MMEKHESRIKELAEKVGIGKPFQLSSFLFMRAMGKDKKDIAKSIGVNRKTLTRWDYRTYQLRGVERTELVVKSVVTEYLERVGGQQ